MSILDILFHHEHSDGQKFGTGELAAVDQFLKPEAPRHEEVAGAFLPATWLEKNPQGSFTTYPKRDQKMKSDCTCYNAAKLLSIDELSENGVWRELSPDAVYPFVAEPGGGASSLAVMNFVVSHGMTLEHLYPSDSLGEAEARDATKIATDAKQVGMVYKPSAMVECTADFETIASIIDGYRKDGKKKGVGITLIGQNNGTWLSAFPTPPKGQNGLWYHRVTVTDFGLVNGEKVLAIDNSWGNSPGYGGQQFLTKAYEPFIYGGAYTLNLPDNWMSAGYSGGKPPTYDWTVDLSPGSTGPDVLALQQALQSMGMFPVTTIVKPTGNYFGVTKKGVELFQQAFGLPVNGLCDAVTREKLNSIF